MAKNKIFQRVLIVLVSLGLYACNGGGDFGSDGSTEEGERVPVVENQEVVVEPSEIASGGTTMLQVRVVYSRQDLVPDPVDIEWNSQCAAEDPPRAVITPQLQIETGVYEAEYQATGCVGDDVITVNLDGTLAANGVVTILSPDVGTLQFVSAEPDRIALSGFGSAEFPEFSDVTFRVLDSQGLPVAGRTVDFELTNTLGGISLVNTSAVSVEAGDAVARLQSGAINTTVRVRAGYTTPDGVLIQTVSGPIAINSGLADQNSMDIATSVFNPLAWNYNYSLDNAPVSISVFASDYYNNPVPDGTQITFVTESGGQILGNCPTVNGACSVPWASSGERPANGVLTLLARVVGEESFDDANGNGLFDVGEIALQDQLPEAWLDANENGVYDVGEDYYDFNSDGRYTEANNLYEGAGCTEEAKAAGNCAALVEVRQDIRLVLSGDDLLITFLGGPVILNTGGTEICYTIEDGRGNIPPAGTSVAVDASVGEIIAGSSSYTIPSAFSTEPYQQCVVVKGTANQSDGGEAEAGFLTVTATVPAPSGLIIERSLGLTEFQEPEEQPGP